MKQRIFQRLTLSDLLLIALLIGAIIYSFFYFRADKSQHKLYIYKDNEFFGVYALKPDREIVIDKHNRVELAAGKVRMVFADCPDKRCVKQGFVQNMPIICLPNKLLVEIKNPEAEKKFILQ